MLFSLLNAGAVASLPSEAHAEFYSGNELYDYCSTDKSDPVYYSKQSTCRGFIAGVVDTVNATRSLSGTASCLPSGVTLAQVTDVVMKHLRENPQYRNLSAAILVQGAIMDAWGCRLPATGPKTK